MPEELGKDPRKEGQEQPPWTLEEYHDQSQIAYALGVQDNGCTKDA